MSPFDAFPKKHIDLWRAARILNLYQISLALLLFFISETQPSFFTLPSNEHALFSGIALAYFIAGLLSTLLRFLKKIHLHAHVVLLSLTDIIALALLLHIYGENSIGFGILFMVSIAGASIIISRTLAINLAALATLVVLGEQLFSHLSSHQLVPADYVQAGVTGLGIFAAALVTNSLSQRARESEDLAEQRHQRLLQAQQLTEYVLQRMQTGVIVLDEQHHIVMINQSALTLLALKEKPQGWVLSQVSPWLFQALHHFMDKTEPLSETFKPSRHSPTLIPRFVFLSGNQAYQAPRMLIFLEDFSAAKQRAQHMKLISMGTLSANIAHEVRNPLGAIAHATQLLSESQLTAPDQRLLNIILAQCKRMNIIVESILQISRGDVAAPVLISLNDKLEKFKKSFSLEYKLDNADLTIKITPENTQVRMNPNHLDQILWNLCGNALRYTETNKGAPKIIIQGGLSGEALCPHIDIIDFGCGVTKKDQPHIFEPFYTQSQEGSGLGLYISMELCEANQARIAYIDKPTVKGTSAKIGACFRIVFADPRRKQLA